MAEHLASAVIAHQNDVFPTQELTPAVNALRDEFETRFNELQRRAADLDTRDQQLAQRRSELDRMFAEFEASGA